MKMIIFLKKFKKYSIPLFFKIFFMFFFWGGGVGVGIRILSIEKNQNRELNNVTELHYRLLVISTMHSSVSLQQSVM